MNHTQPTFANKVVRRSINKGTKFIDEPIKPSYWTGKEFKEKEIERLRLAGDLMIISGKGTQKIRLSEMQQTTTPETKGRYISTGKGTGITVL